MKFKKNELPMIINFLGEVSLTGKISRKRSKLVKKLTDFHSEYVEDQKSILEEHATKDEEGKPKIKKSGEYDIPKDKISLANEQLKELHEEFEEIKQGEYSDNFKALYDHLNGDSFVMELSGNNAQAYDRLMEEFEADQASE